MKVREDFTITEEAPTSSTIYSLSRGGRADDHLVAVLGLHLLQRGQDGLGLLLPHLRHVAPPDPSPAQPEADQHAALLDEEAAANQR